MGDFFGGSNAQKVIKYSALQTGRSQYDVAIPWIRGQRRVGANCIWANDFQSHKHSAKGKGGGKGASQYTYTAAVILAIGYGTINAIYNVWSQGSSSTASTLGGPRLHALRRLGPARCHGLTSRRIHPTEALAYGKIAYVVHPNLDLGSAASVPDLGFEVRCTPYADVFVSAGYENPTSHVVTDGHDCNMADILPDFLTDPLAGCGFVSGDIPDLSDFRAAQAAQGLFFSPCLHNQEKGLDIINRWARISNSWMYWSGTSLVVVPLADTTITGNGYTFTPDLTPVYDLGPDDFISNPPVQVDIKDPADCHSRTTVSITDRTMGYATNPIEYKSQSLIRKYGRRDSDNVQADEICCPAVGEIVAQLLGRRSANLTQTFKWQTKWHFIRLLPGAIVTVTDPTQNLDAVPVRITDVEEDESGNLSFTAEELPTSIGTHHARTVQAGPKPSTPDILIDPGNVNVPAVVEPAGLIAGGKAKVLIAASGGANWGGCNVWLSFDGTSYSQIGTITAPAIQGRAYGRAGVVWRRNPDVGHTLSVDCTQSQGEPDAVTNADAAALRTLSLVCAPPTTVGPDKVLASSGELLAFGATSATGHVQRQSDLSLRGCAGHIRRFAQHERPVHAVRYVGQ
jgi:hypothetical protein